MPDLGAPELLIVLAVVLLYFGPCRLTDLGRRIGESIPRLPRDTGGKPRATGGDPHPLPGTMLELLVCIAVAAAIYAAGIALWTLQR